MKDCIVYANKINGIEFSQITNVRITNFQIFDNAVDGVEITHAGGFWTGPRIQDSLFVAKSEANGGRAQKGGIHLPQSIGTLLVQNVWFVGFNAAGSVCLTGSSHGKSDAGGFEVYFKNINFHNSANHKGKWNWEHETLIRDLDGSLTGKGAGSWALAYNGMLKKHIDSGACEIKSEWSARSFQDLGSPGGVSNVSVCFQNFCVPFSFSILTRIRQHE